MCGTIWKLYQTVWKPLYQIIAMKLYQTTSFNLLLCISPQQLPNCVETTSLFTAFIWRERFRGHAVHASFPFLQQDLKTYLYVNVMPYWCFDVHQSLLIWLLQEDLAVTYINISVNLACIYIWTDNKVGLLCACWTELE